MAAVIHSYPQRLWITVLADGPGDPYGGPSPDVPEAESGALNVRAVA
ncbi:MAG: hypothetical protein QOI83_3754 [Streptomycetaceae bacterium]|jgi:hypothetical protein|nr:hypothetical protein [Streptomycetaceae bacterium]